MTAAEPDPDTLSARYRPRLEAEAEGLRTRFGETDARRPVMMDQQSVGRLSRTDAMHQQAMVSALEARRGARTRAIALALRRLEEGEFGYCADCGGVIGFARLDLDATLMRCVDCAGQG